MPDDATKFTNWVNTKGDAAIGAISGAVELFKMLRPGATLKAVPLRDMMTGDPITDRAIGDAVGVAAIAGRNGVSVDDILTAANLIKGLAIMLTAIV